jgi:hypothetical protein
MYVISSSFIRIKFVLSKDKVNMSVERELKEHFRIDKIVKSDREML